MGKENQEPDVRGETRLDSVFWVLLCLQVIYSLKQASSEGTGFFSFIH